MTGPRTHFVGDGCEPPHFLTILTPEDPEEVRKRDAAHWDDVPVEGARKRPKKLTTEGDYDGTSSR